MSSNERSSRAALGLWVPSPLEGTVTNHSNIPDDSTPERLDPLHAELHDDDITTAVFTTPRQVGRAEPYDLGWLFLCWAWGAGYRDWHRAVRVFAKVLRGLEGSELIERRTIRRVGHVTHHGFVLTDRARDVLEALSADWIRKVGR